MPENEEGVEDVTGMEEDAGSETLAIDLDKKGETEEEPKPTEEASPKEKQPNPQTPPECDRVAKSSEYEICIQ